MHLKMTSTSIPKYILQKANGKPIVLNTAKQSIIMSYLIANSLFLNFLHDLR